MLLLFRMCVLIHHNLQTLSRINLFIVKCPQSLQQTVGCSYCQVMILRYYCHCFSSAPKMDMNLSLLLLQVLTAGEMRVGWARPGCLPDQELGSDDQAFVFDGFKVADFSLLYTSYLFSFLVLQWNNIFSKLLSKLVINGESFFP